MRGHQANIVQMSFMTAPKHLAELEHQVKVDERVMRYMFYKAGDYPSLKELKDEMKDKAYEAKLELMGSDLIDAQQDGKGNVIQRSPMGNPFLGQKMQGTGSREK